MKCKTCKNYPCNLLKGAEAAYAGRPGWAERRESVFDAAFDNCQRYVPRLDAPEQGGDIELASATAAITELTGMLPTMASRCGHWFAAELYASRARLSWLFNCKECGNDFEPDFFGAADPAERRGVCCPCCGQFTEPMSEAGW